MASCHPCGHLGAAPPLPPCPCDCPTGGPPTIPVIADSLPKNPVDATRVPMCVPVQIPSTQPPCPVVNRTRKCKYIQPPRPKSFAPIRKFIPPEMKMEECTIYRKSYLPVCDVEKSKMIVPPGNLCVGQGKIAQETINKMSYLPHKVLPPCPIYPCEHKLIGEGPMQDITTNKHDYGCKPFTKTDPIKPPTNLFSSECPLSDKTVNRMSYMPVDLNQVKVQPFYPVNAISKPTGKIADKTIHNLSYQPWQPQSPMELPWAQKPVYQPPKLRMDGSTINKMSYAPPGTYVECADDDPDCIECTEPEHGPRCPLPCCCPRAAC